MNEWVESVERGNMGKHTELWDKYTMQEGEKSIARWRKKE